MNRQPLNARWQQAPMFSRNILCSSSSYVTWLAAFYYSVDNISRGRWQKMEERFAVVSKTVSVLHYSYVLLWTLTICLNFLTATAKIACIRYVFMKTEPKVRDSPRDISILSTWNSEESSRNINSFMGGYSACQNHLCVYSALLD